MTHPFALNCFEQLRSTLHCLLQYEEVFSGSASAVVSCMMSCAGHMVHVQGLAVELRPYQRQSLQFMLDAEQTEGGCRHHLFLPVTNSKGEQYWCSPHLGRLCLHVPPMPHGGFLGEDPSRNITFRCTHGLRSTAGDMLYVFGHTLMITHCMHITLLSQSNRQQAANMCTQAKKWGWERRWSWLPLS